MWRWASAYRSPFRPAFSPFTACRSPGRPTSPSRPSTPQPPFFAATSFAAPSIPLRTGAHMPRIAQTTIDQIKERIPVHQVASRWVQLKRAGREWKGLSPFKSERHASFMVHDDRFHCFSTGEHGTSIDLLMRLGGLTFPEAVEQLAAEAGIPVTRDGLERETR